MSSSPSPVVYPPLPPTTNILSSEQRARLVRSSRKLGSVLGSTPYLVEEDHSFAMLPIRKTTSRALKRQGSIFTHYHTSSLSITSTSTASSHYHSPSASSFVLPQGLASPMQSSESLLSSPPGLPTTRRCRVGDKAPQLFLRINPVSSSLDDDYALLSVSPALSSSRPPSPVTPAVPDDTEIRRKRMAKLARHLGEHVPAELVFASNPAPKRASKTHQRRSQSVFAFHGEGARIGDKKPTQQLKQDWVGEWNRSNIRDVQKELRNLRIR